MLSSLFVMYLLLMFIHYFFNLHQDVDMVRLLLQLGASWTDVDAEGDSPLVVLPAPMLNEVVYV